MSESPLLGIGFGLTAASSWGTGDFCAGLASKRTHVYGVVILSQLVGLGLLLVLAFLLAEPSAWWPYIVGWRPAPWGSWLQWQQSPVSSSR
jgi:drug/metabolite transporter (DMT)-like permease